MKEIVMIITTGVFIGVIVAGIVLYLITKFVDIWEEK